MVLAVPVGSENVALFERLTLPLGNVMVKLGEGLDVPVRDTVNVGNVMVFEKVGDGLNETVSVGSENVEVPVPVIDTVKVGNENELEAVGSDIVEVTDFVNVPDRVGSVTEYEWLTVPVGNVIDVVAVRNVRDFVSVRDRDIVIVGIVRVLL